MEKGDVKIPRRSSQAGNEEWFTYLSKDLFWQAMEDISEKATLISEHSGTELRDMIEAEVEVQSQIYSVKAVTVPTIPEVVFSRIVATDHLSPGKTKRHVVALFEDQGPRPQ